LNILANTSPLGLFVVWPTTNKLASFFGAQKEREVSSIAAAAYEFG
jgi:hypothetical protein